jgi:hypothetical protein
MKNVFAIMGDHGMTESGMASRVNTDAGDMRVSIAGLAKSAASA